MGITEYTIVKDKSVTWIDEEGTMPYVYKKIGESSIFVIPVKDIYMSFTGLWVRCASFTFLKDIQNRYRLIDNEDEIRNGRILNNEHELHKFLLPFTL